MNQNSESLLFKNYLVEKKLNRCEAIVDEGNSSKVSINCPNEGLIRCEGRLFCPKCKTTFRNKVVPMLNLFRKSQSESPQFNWQESRRAFSLLLRRTTFLCPNTQPICQPMIIKRRHNGCCSRSYSIMAKRNRQA